MKYQLMVCNNNCFGAWVWVAALLCVFTFLGCQRASQGPPPGYVLTIPADIPDKFVPRRKSVSDPIQELNGREIYAFGHRLGWEECWKLYQEGKLDPNNEQAEPFEMQDSEFVRRAKKDGFTACRHWIQRNKPNR